MPEKQKLSDVFRGYSNETYAIYELIGMVLVSLFCRSEKYSFYSGGAFIHNFDYLFACWLYLK